ncbi:MAG: RNA polymerase factor sigma-54 [Alphaproteobacteria bacterium]|nr:RNA polymerase factor sigma-54 [Alphaproteobacteria bacterium]
MAITPRLEIKQTQSLLMTQQLRQAINLLQMNNIELNDIINQELAQNPLLEKEEEHLSNQLDVSSPTIDDLTSPPDSEEEFIADFDLETSFDDYGSDSQDYQSESDYSWSTQEKSKINNISDPDFDYCSQRLSSKKSLYVYISEQISQIFTDTKQKIIAWQLTEHLDQAGYFRGDIQQIANNLKCGQDQISHVLEQLKNFEPAGIFAESLSECLKIQLQDINRYDPAIAILLDNLPLLAEGKYKELQRLCHADAEDLFSMISDIKSLNPKPALGWDLDPATYIIPDVFVRRKKNGNYIVELNNDTLPRLLINHKYYSDLLQKDKSAKRFLNENLNSANFLLKAMHQRATTILRVSEEIIRTQQNFLEYGIDHLKPLSLKDIAYNLEMHESTISRVTSNKYMHTPRGIFELKFFFSAAAGSYIGKEDVSTLTIKHKIKNLISQEDPKHVLSDDKIGELLATEGIKIARRTVAKYRESLNIPTSAERKRLHRQKI